VGSDHLSFADQRLRLFWRLRIVDGVSFTTRSDWLETVWGQNEELVASTGRAADFFQQSVGVDQTYVTFKTGIGQFSVGYKSGTPYGWGTNFMDSTGTGPGVVWSYDLGPTTILAGWTADDTADFTNARVDLTGADEDNDYYDLGVKTKFKGGDAGLLLTYFRQAAGRPGANGVLIRNFNIQPYVRTKLGPVNLEAEAYWMGGEADFENPATQDQDITGRGLYVGARFDMGPAYVGGRFIYSSGDDPTTNDELEGSVNSQFGYGRDKSMFGDFNSFLFNNWTMKYIRARGAATSPGTTAFLDNLWEFQVNGGMAITKKFDVMARLSYLKADEVPAGVDKDYGYELDVKATYKIYDALSYNVGGAYLWTGDYYKGTTANFNIKDVYMLYHWIELSF
jgi:hypothetical protein